MKLSKHIIDIDRAVIALLRSQKSGYHNGRWIQSDLPRECPRTSIPVIVPQQPTNQVNTPLSNKITLLQLAAFEATYYHSKTPIISLDVFPLILDTGGQYLSQFSSPHDTCPVLEDKGNRFLSRCGGDRKSRIFIPQ